MRQIAANQSLQPLRGFTLVELIVSITLMALLCMAAIPLLKLPLEGWIDATRRATLSTELDIIHAKLRDDLALALPGSVRTRTVGGRVLLEYLEVRAAGRYRSNPSPGAPLCPTSCSGTAGANDSFEAGCPETCLVNLSPWAPLPPTLGTNDWLVVNPTGAISPYVPGAAGIRSRALTAQANGRVELAPHNFPTPSPLRLFYIVSGPVTWECNPASRQLLRHANYAITSLQPAAFGGATTAMLTRRVQSCVNALSYQALGAGSQGGLVSVLLRLGPGLGEPTSTEVADLQASFGVSENP